MITAVKTLATRVDAIDAKMDSFNEWLNKVEYNLNKKIVDLRKGNDEKFASMKKRLDYVENFKKETEKKKKSWKKARAND